MADISPNGFLTARALGNANVKAEVVGTPYVFPDSIRVNVVAVGGH